MTGDPGDEDGITTPKGAMMNVSAPQQHWKAGPAADMAPVEKHPIRPIQSQKPKSSPSTPHHRPQPNQDQHGSPTASQLNREGSPRSLNSESSATTPALRRPLRGCKFEAGMAKARRRVPYSLGPEVLETEPDELKRKMGPEAVAKLTSDMQDLYSRLVPTPESEEKRRLFVQKLESLLRERWPNQLINVSVFGSTGNRLGTNDSDIDICITTDCKELEHVCSLAELLDKNGMERIVCVSSARVPIVKVWDPELQVASDMNVNNPIALENTQMVRSYTMIDERFRPLAMIVKYWAKQRILNDAALGGTLSSYTWICMVINFLQTRNPPILPSLQIAPDLEPKMLGGVNVAFDKALDKYRDFGFQNQSTIGELLFEFFRFYGHELDFAVNALSVRLGKVILKSQKAWHLLQDNRLCVEEPFNTSRNLANTADDTSMRGIHLELRRAFELIVEGKLDACCEQYEPGPEERKQTETFIHPTARPIIPQAPTQPAAQSNRNNRSGFRSVRHHRNSTRRASNPAGRNANYLHDLPFQMTPQELQLQAQHQQHLLHDQLFQQYQYLQLQEQELRMQLYQQNLRQRGLGLSQSNSQNGYSGGTTPDSASVLNGTTPLRLNISPTALPNRYAATSPFLRNSTPASGVMTNPASPLLTSILPESSRRYARRTSIPSSSPAGSLRAQSQPARSFPFTGGFSNARPIHDLNGDSSDASIDRRTSYSYHPHMYIPQYTSQPPSVSGSLYEAGRRPAEYLGYYVGQSPSLLAHARSAAISPIPSRAGLAIHNGGLSPRLSSRSSRLPSVASSPSQQSANLEAVSEALVSTHLTNGHNVPRRPHSPPPQQGPLIVDGSVYSPQRRRPTGQASTITKDGCNISASTSDDLGIDTPSSSDDQYQEYRKTSLAKRRSQNVPAQIVNGLPGQLRTLSIAPETPPATAPINDSPATSGTVDSIMELPGRVAVLGDSASQDFASLEKIDGKINGSSGRRRKPRTEKASPTFMNHYAESSTPLGLRTNGQTATSSSPISTIHIDASNGWQTAKKKKRARKVTRSENDAVLVNNAGGDLQPLDEKLRKGG